MDIFSTLGEQFGKNFLPRKNTTQSIDVQGFEALLGGVGNSNLIMYF